MNPTMILSLCRFLSACQTCLQLIQILWCAVSPLSQRVLFASELCLWACESKRRPIRTLGPTNGSPKGSVQIMKCCLKSQQKMIVILSIIWHFLQSFKKKKNTASILSTNKTCQQKPVSSMTMSYSSTTIVQLHAPEPLEVCPSKENAHAVALGDEVV